MPDKVQDGEVNRALPPLRSRLEAVRRTRRDGVVVLVLFFGTAAAAVLIAHHFHIGAPGTFIAALFSGGATPAAYVAWRTFSQGQASLDLTLPEVANMLAVAVREQWEKELFHRLNDQFPLKVSWTPVAPSVSKTWAELVALARNGINYPRNQTWASNSSKLAGSGGDLMKVLELVPIRRLLVLGGRGAGKTMLMVQLVLDLLTARDADPTTGKPVPVLLSLASWNPNDRTLHDWLADRLTIDYPALGQHAAEGTTRRANALLSQNLIMPILDGLDEIPIEARRAAITGINESLRLGLPLVITCRTEPYKALVHAGFGDEATLHAAVVEVQPLSAAGVARYLKVNAKGPTAASRWKAVIDALGKQVPVAHALTTPLMAGLASFIYNSNISVTEAHDPAELLSPQMADRKTVECHLLDAYIETAYRSAQGATATARWTPEASERYLAFLVRHLRGNQSDITWWDLASAAPRHFVGMAVGLVVAVASAITYPFIGWGAGMLVGLAISLPMRHIRTRRSDLTHAIAGGLAGGLLGGLLVLAILGPGNHGYRESGLLAAGLATGVAVSSVQNWIASFAGGFLGSLAGGYYEHAPLLSPAREAVGPWLHLLNGLGFGLSIFVYIEVAGRRLPARRPGFSVRRMAIGIAYSAVLATGVWLQAGWRDGLLAGLFLASAGTLFGGLGETKDLDLRSPVDIAAMLRYDRLRFMIAWIGVGVSSAIGGGFALAVSKNIHGQPNGWMIGLMVGLANILVIGLAAAFIQAMWGYFALARCWLALVRHQLPWRYVEFLDDAHKRGVLSQVGAVYQFRHAEVRERFMERYMP